MLFLKDTDYYDEDDYKPYTGTLFPELMEDYPVLKTRKGDVTEGGKFWASIKIHIPEDESNINDDKYALLQMIRKAFNAIVRSEYDIDKVNTDKLEFMISKIEVSRQSIAINPLIKEIFNTFNKDEIVLLMKRLLEKYNTDIDTIKQFCIRVDDDTYNLLALINVEDLSGGNSFAKFLGEYSDEIENGYYNVVEKEEEEELNEVLEDEVEEENEEIEDELDEEEIDEELEEELDTDEEDDDDNEEEAEDWFADDDELNEEEYYYDITGREYHISETILSDNNERFSKDGNIPVYEFDEYVEKTTNKKEDNINVGTLEDLFEEETTKDTSFMESFTKDLPTEEETSTEEDDHAWENAVDQDDEIEDVIEEDLVEDAGEETIEEPTVEMKGSEKPNPFYEFKVGDRKGNYKYTILAWIEKDGSLITKVKKNEEEN